MHRVSLLESKRIVSVLEDLLLDLQCLSLLPLYNAEGDDPAAASSPFSKLSAEIQAHVQLERKLEESAAKGASQRSQYTAVLDHVKASITALCHEMRHISSSAQFGQNAAFNRKIQRFMGVIREMKDMIALRLRSTVEEDRSHEEFLRETIAREKKANSDVKSIGRDVNLLKTIRERDVAFLDKAISKLKVETTKVTGSAQAENSQMEGTYKKLGAESQAQFASKQKESGDKFSRISADLGTIGRSNKESEEIMRKLRSKREGEVVSWLQKYDADMEAKTTEMEGLTAEFNRDQKRLDELEEKLRQFDEERLRREEDAEKLLAEEEMKEQQEKVLMRSATLIQAQWRGHLVRKSMSQTKLDEVKPDKKPAKGKGKKGAK